MLILLQWVKAHFQELLHHILLWHWGFLTVARASEFRITSLESQVNGLLVIVWIFAIWNHFRRRLCNTKMNRRDV